jgi:hypothetical protein
MVHCGKLHTLTLGDPNSWGILFNQTGRVIEISECYSSREAAEQAVKNET